MRTRTTPRQSGPTGYETIRRAWWDRIYEELAGRTPTDALNARDEASVVDLINRWYRDSEEGAERRRHDADFVAMIEERSTALRQSS